MALLTVAEVRAHVETDLSDEALGRLIDDADAEIIETAGAVDEQVDEMHHCELANVLFLSRRALAVTEVVETLGDGDTTLAADDHQLRNGGTQIERLASGANPRTTWGESVKVTYTPTAHTARRIRVLIDLVRLAVQYNALSSESVGDYSATQRKYEEERTSLLSRLREGLSFA